MELGDAGLEDRTSRPARFRTETPEEIADQVEAIRREKKWGPDRITAHLNTNGVEISASTVHRILKKRGLNHRRVLDPTGDELRKVNRYEYGTAGGMLHVDVKKVGKIPDGGGWAVHGRDSIEALRSHRKANKRPGYTYLHAVIDDYSRIAYVEAHEDEKAETAIAVFERALVFFRGHGFTHVGKVLTDNGSAYISNAWKIAMADYAIKHVRTKRQTPRTNGKVERFNRTMKEEWLYVRAYTSEEDRRAWLVPFLNDYNHDRFHSAVKGVPVSRAPEPGPKLTVDDMPVEVPRRLQMALDLTA